LVFVFLLSLFSVVSARSLAKVPKVYVKVRVGEQRGSNGSKTARVASVNGSANWNASFEFGSVAIDHDLVALELKSAPNAIQNLKQSFATSPTLHGSKPSISATCFVPLTSLKSTDRHEDWWPLAPNGKSHHTTSGEILVCVERISPSDASPTAASDFPPPSPADSDLLSHSPDERSSPPDNNTQSSPSTSVTRRRVTFHRTAFTDSAPLPDDIGALSGDADMLHPHWRSSSMAPQIAVEAPELATGPSLLSADDMVEPTDDDPYGVGSKKLRRGSDSLLNSAFGKQHARAKSDGMIGAPQPQTFRSESTEFSEMSATTDAADLSTADVIASVVVAASGVTDASSSSSSSSSTGSSTAVVSSSSSGSGVQQSVPPYSRLLKNFVANRSPKQRAKVLGFRKLFQLGEHEELLVDWQASIVKNGLCFAGRMYVGTSVITFASSIFGIKTRECIPASEIVSVMRSGAQFGVGGVVQITTASSSKYRFVLMGIAGIESDIGILRAVVAGDIDGALRLVIGGEGTLDTAQVTTADDVHESLELAQSIADADADARYLSIAIPAPLLLGVVSERVEVIQQQLEGFSVVRFFDMLFGDDSPIFAAYRQARGDVDVVLSPWDTVTGRRLLTCRSPIKAPLGPNSTKVDEIQQYHLTKQQLELSMQVTAHDVPYGSYFVSESLWIVVPTADGRGVDVRVRVGVHFRKWTMLRNKIQSACVSELKLSYEMLLQLARQHSARSLSDVSLEHAAGAAAASVAAAAAVAAAVANTNNNNATAQAQVSMRDVATKLLTQLQAHDLALTAMCVVGVLLLWILWRIEGHLGTIATQCGNALQVHSKD
jgi:hypothetical protein